MSRISRPRYRKHRRRSRGLAAFLALMATKWSGQETERTVTAVGATGLTLAVDPTGAGPYTLRGAPPPELRGVDRFFISIDGSHHAKVYPSREAMAAGRDITLASWALTLALKSLTTTAPAVAVLGANVDVATVGATLAISAVTNGADTLTRIGHGFAVEDGPFYIASGGAIPAGLAALTPYWIQAIPTADTFKLAASKGGPAINITDDGSGAITIAPVNVDVDTDALHAVAHGFATGDLVRLTTNGALPTGLAVATNYWAIRVDADHIAFASSLANAQAGTKISLTAAGNGTTSIFPCRVDTSTDTITFTSAHGLSTGDIVRASTSSSLPTGLLTATDYWVIKVSNTALKLADSLAHANSNTPIDITAIGAGTDTITLEGVDTTLEDFRSVAHGMETGDGPITLATDGSLPTGLAAATPYYVIKIDADHFALATSRVNALASTKINLTGIGSGNHTLTRALKIGKDLSEAGLLLWLNTVKKASMQSGDTADVETIFV